MTVRVLNVWWNGRIVGQFTQDQHGDIGFAYAEAWLEDEKALPLSVSLPKRPERFSRRECRPFFGGLLPEESQRLVAAQALGVSPANDFALLDRLGGDVAGALQLLPEDHEPIGGGLIADRQTAALDEAGIVRILDALPTRPLLAGQEGLRLSLAGAQSKAPVVLIDGQVALPLPGQATTHILKPPIARFPGTTENEAFAMRLAAAIGLDVAPVDPRSANSRPFLLVNRYDRHHDGDGVVLRIHQEDFCQALGVPPETKYASEGGRPSRIASSCCVGSLRGRARTSLSFWTLRFSISSSEMRMLTVRISRSSMTILDLGWLRCTTCFPPWPIQIFPRNWLCGSANARRLLTWALMAGRLSRRRQVSAYL